MTILEKIVDFIKVFISNYGKKQKSWKKQKITETLSWANEKKLILTHQKKCVTAKISNLAGRKGTFYRNTMCKKKLPFK